MCGSTVTSANEQSKCYELGEGDFRGVLWPTTKGGNFSAWVIAPSGGRASRWLVPSNDYHFDIAAPRFSWGEAATDVRPSSSIADKHNPGFDIHSVTTVAGTTFTVRLPRRTVPYTYQVHHEANAEALTFMSLAESVSQRGIFGYVIAKRAQ